MRPFTAMLLAAAACAGLAFPGAPPAGAGDVQGDAYSCEELWVMRNRVYKDNGYCFATERAIAFFGNESCAYTSEDSVPLSSRERSTIRVIRASEDRQGC